MFIKGGLFLVLITSVYGHGFMFSPIDSKVGSVRGLDKLNTQIDSLRNPLNGNEGVCRGVTQKTQKTPLRLVNGQSHTLTMALSIAAQHVGPCSVEILDATNLNQPGIVIGDAPNCARDNVEIFDTPGPASSQCPSSTVPTSVTNDMCLHKFTFTVKNADKITCGDNCVLRWLWAGEHKKSEGIIEKYENCADVSIQSGKGVSTDTTSTKGSTSVSATGTVVQATSSPSATASQGSTRTVTVTVTAESTFLPDPDPQEDEDPAVVSGDDFKLTNAQRAFTLDQQKASVKQGDACQGSDAVCMGDQVGMCDGGRVVLLSSCSTGTSCQYLPLVSRPGITVSCTTEADKLARLAANGFTVPKRRIRKRRF